MECTEIVIVHYVTSNQKSSFCEKTVYMGKESLQSIAKMLYYF